jgi:hypothetical protein
MRYGCLKITRSNEDRFKVGKHGSTWDNVTTWASSKLQYRGHMRNLEKKCHNVLLTILFCVNESFPSSL